MNAIEHFNDAIDYIEKHLTKEIDVGAMAKMAQMSIYEFRRVFSFAAGISLSEYIRRRRLSAAAQEMKTAASVTEVALKYGYDTPSSFSRAFKEFHGISPSQFMQSGEKVNLFTRIGFDFQCTGGQLIRYEIREEDGFYVCGLTGMSSLEDTECCEDVWQQFNEQEPENNEVLYAAYQNGENAVICTIGKRSVRKDEERNNIYIPPARWVCFQMRGSDDQKVNAFYKRILVDFFRSGHWKRAQGVPNLEIFPADMEADDFLWEICIPVE